MSGEGGIMTLDVAGVEVVYRPSAQARRDLRSTFARTSVPKTRIVPAVRGVSFTLQAGDVLGIVGANGSGKSSLLRAIAGLQPLEAGKVRAVSPPVLLGVGAVLKPKLSGRSNIMIGGLALGVSRQELEARSDEIIDFSGLLEFIDLPMNTYSSGMRARLLFSVSTIVKSEILLLDEALAVGDAAFRKRSRERIKEMAADAGTVIIVTHRLGAVRSTCNRAIWLHDGVVRVDGRPNKVIRAYRRWVNEPGEVMPPTPDEPMPNEPVPDGAGSDVPDESAEAR